MSAFETVIYERSGAVAYLTLNRPRMLNAYSIGMRDDLFEILDGLRCDDEIRVIVFNGSGEKAFCGGADLTEFLTAPSAISARKIRALRDLWALFRSIPQVTIAALHGYVLGSGMEIALFCDMRIGSEDVMFGLPEIGLGIIPGAGGTQTLPRAIGLSRSLDMLLGNRRMGSAEAYRVGLLDRLVQRSILLQDAQKLANEIADKPRPNVAAIKRAIFQGLELPLQQGLQLEAHLAASVCLSADNYINRV